MKTYQHPQTKDIKYVPNDNDVQAAALEKLGYVTITAADIKGEPTLEVTYEQVTNPRLPEQPPALPKLTVPVADAPTRDTSKTGVTRDDVVPLGKDTK